jgi:cystathionine beta-lyase family protein involved in aluminum resistance
MGTVEGAGTYAEGATATLTATPAVGHQFVNWTVGGETLTENPLTLTVTSDITAVANFAVIKHTVTATANDPAMGTVEGAGTYAEGATATLTATPAVGHQFLNWTVGGETLTENPLTLTVTGDITAVANFAVIEHTVTVTANDPAMGTVEGAGTYEEGATATLTATANTGYAFVSWLVDGETFTDNLLILTVESDVVVEAIFQKDLTTNTESVDTNQQKVEKRFQDGHLYILRDGDTYTTTGARVK